MTWPTIQAPSYPLEEGVYKPQIKNEFESGYVQSRPRATISKRRWRLQWRAMTEADWLLLSAAFAADSGNTFSWSHPASGEYTVRYADDEIRSTAFTNGLRQVSVNLEEAP
jgi:hypothetical protein